MSDKYADDNRDKRNERRQSTKRKGVWAEVKTFEEAESGLAVIITERVRGAPAYSFQIVAMDKRGVNKFIQVPCSGTIDVEHIVFSLAKRARDFIAEKIAKDIARTKSKKEREQDKKKDDDKKNDKDVPKKTRRGSRGKGSGDGKGSRKPQGGLSALAKKDAKAAGHDFVGPTRRRKEKQQKKSA